MESGVGDHPAFFMCCVISADRERRGISLIFFRQWRYIISMDPEGKMPDLVTAVLSFVLPLCITLFVLPRFSHIAAELGLVDMPSRRKVHRSPKPLVGGLAMSLGVA